MSGPVKPVSEIARAARAVPGISPTVTSRSAGELEVLRSGFSFPPILLWAIVGLFVWRLLK